MAQTTTQMRHFLRMTDVTPKQLRGVLSQAKKLKAMPRQEQRALLTGQTMAMLFEKPSLRTHLSFETGMTQLGGHAVYMGSSIGMGKREPIRDVSRVISSMVDIVCARVFKHNSVRELATYSTVPVINALCDLEHPCQAVADFLTIEELKGELGNSLKFAFVGDGNNNITHSLALGCALLGVQFRVASPDMHWMNRQVAELARDIASETGGSILETSAPDLAVADADVVYTDTWVSMGEEAQREQRERHFKGFQVDDALMKHASPNALFMHDMPAYRGLEVSSSVIDGPQSVIIHQASNRLHAQKAIVLSLFNVEV